MTDEQPKASAGSVPGDDLLDVSLRDARDTALNATEAMRVTSAAIAANTMLEAIDTMATIFPFVDNSEKSPAKQAVRSFLEIAAKSPLRG